MTNKQVAWICAIGAVLFVGFAVFDAITDIGDLPYCSKPYSAWLPIQVLVSFGIPALLGFFAGRFSRL